MVDGAFFFEEKRHCFKSGMLWNTETDIVAILSTLKF